MFFNNIDPANVHSWLVFNKWSKSETNKTIIHWPLNKTPLLLHYGHTNKKCPCLGTIYFTLPLWVPPNVLPGHIHWKTSTIFFHLYEWSYPISYLEAWKTPCSCQCDISLPDRTFGFFAFVFVVRIRHFLFRLFFSSSWIGRCLNGNLNAGVGDL